MRVLKDGGCGFLTWLVWDAKALMEKVPGSHFTLFTIEKFCKKEPPVGEEGSPHQPDLCIS